MLKDSHEDHKGMGIEEPGDNVLRCVRQVLVARPHNLLAIISITFRAVKNVTPTVRILWPSISVHVFAFDSDAHLCSQRSTPRHAHKT